MSLFLLFLFPISLTASEPAPFQTITASGDQSKIEQVTVLQDTFFFSAHHVLFGQELWALAPDTRQPHLVADLAPGVLDSSPEQLTPAGNRLFFVTDQPTIGSQFGFWDPQQGITLFAEPTGYGNRLFGPFNGVMLGSADDQIYRLDETGPQKLALPVAHFGKKQLFGLGDTLYLVEERPEVGYVLSRLVDDRFEEVRLFLAETRVSDVVDAYHLEIVPAADGQTAYLLVSHGPDHEPTYDLWRTDGSADGTIHLFSAGYIVLPTLLGDHLYFAAGPTMWATTLHRTDGTPQGSMPFADQSRLISGLTALDQHLIVHTNHFEDADDKTMNLLVDDTLQHLANYELITEFNATHGSLQTPGDGYAYGYIAADGEVQVMRTDGTIEGTSTYQSATLDPRDLAYHKGRLLSAADPSPLLFTDDNVGALVLDPKKLDADQPRYNLHVVNERVYTVSDHTLWRVDGDTPRALTALPAGTEIHLSRFQDQLVVRLDERVILLNEDSLASVTLDLAIEEVAACDDVLYLLTLGSPESMLYRWDGEGDPVLVDLLEDAASFSHRIACYQDRVYYARMSPGLALVSASGPDDITLVAPIGEEQVSISGLGLTDLTVIDGRLHIEALEPVYSTTSHSYIVQSTRLSTDGTTEGTTLDPFGGHPILQLASGPVHWRAEDRGMTALYPLDQNQPILDAIYIADGWSTAQPVNGILPVAVNPYFERVGAVWLTDGTSQGTHPVPGLEHVNKVSRYLGQAGDHAFVMFEEFGVQTLWALHITRGVATELGTHFDVRQAETAGFENRFYFVNNRPEVGPQLWVSDGSVEGTGLWTDEAGVVPLNPDQLRSTGDQFWFRAWSPDAQWQWWRQKATLPPLEVGIVNPWLLVGSCPATALARGDIQDATLAWEIVNGDIIGAASGLSVRYRANSQLPVQLSLTVTRDGRQGTAKTGAFVLRLPRDPCL